MPRWYPGSTALEPSQSGSVLAIGNFDGVHRGHQALVSLAVADARSLGARPLALTFDPHPALVLGGRRPPILTTTERKLELLNRLDPQLAVVVEPFDRALAEVTAEQFVEQVLVGRLRVRRVVVGANFRFGRDRLGGSELLAEMGKSLGFSVHGFALSGDEQGVISSSRVRGALAQGQLETVEELLGRPHSLSGLVVHGQARGRTIGFPTANLENVQEGLPPTGVYVCVVERLRPGEPPLALAPGVVHIGPRPTVGLDHAVEAHLLDFSEDLYGARLRLHLLGRLRGEQKFESLDALKSQIALDVAAARVVLGRRADVPAESGWF